MSTYGVKVFDINGKVCVLTPDIGTVISSGRITMPSGLVDTDKYYATVNLPDTIPIEDLSVLITPVKWTMKVIRQVGTSGYGDYTIQSVFLDDNYNYYSKNESTGVLTTHTAGNRTLSNPSTWHHSITAYPIVYWEQLGETDVSDIKIFAATCYCTNITTSTTWDLTTTSPVNQFRYSIYTSGVETVDYMIICKKYNY